MEGGRVLLICDEASGIPDAVYQAASGSMSGHNCTTILAGNPIRLSGLFYDTFHSLSDLWTTYHVPSASCTRVNSDFEMDMARRYGKGGNGYRIHWQGEFPLSEADAVIPRDLAVAALTRDVGALPVQPVWGLDVAFRGDDRSALCKRRGNVVSEAVLVWQGLDPMELAGRIKAEYDLTREKDKPSAICVDAIGLGSGVAHRLRELGLPSREINVAESSSMKEKYSNTKTELWFTARDWFEARNCYLSPENAKLVDELCQAEFKTLDSTGKLAMRPKDEQQGVDGYRSPDLADAFILTFAAPSISASGWQPTGGQPVRYRNIGGLP